MNYSDAIEWHDAIEWLIENYESFPAKVLAGISRNVSNPMFKNWRWILTLENEVVFGNGYQPGIVKSDFDAYKSAMEQVKS